MGMDTEQDQTGVTLDPDILIEVLQEQVETLTKQNTMLGAYTRQLQGEVKRLMDSISQRQQKETSDEG